MEEEKNINKEEPKQAIVNITGCYCSICKYRVGDNNEWTQATVKYCSNCGNRLKYRIDSE